MADASVDTTIGMPLSSSSSCSLPPRCDCPAVDTVVVVAVAAVVSYCTILCETRSPKTLFHVRVVFLGMNYAICMTETNE